MKIRRCISLFLVILLISGGFPPARADEEFVDFSASFTESLNEDMTVYDIMSSALNRAVITVSLSIDAILSPDRDPRMGNLGAYLINNSYVGRTDNVIVVMMYYDNTILCFLYLPHFDGKASYNFTELSSVTSSTIESIMESMTDKYYVNSSSEITKVMGWVSEALN